MGFLVIRLIEARSLEAKDTSGITLLVMFILFKGPAILTSLLRLFPQKDRVLQRQKVKSLKSRATHSFMKLSM
jgi:hypothetical protein